MNSFNYLLRALTNKRTQNEQDSLTRCNTNPLPYGYIRCRTEKGQVYFVGPSKRESWFDPRVPRELLQAGLNLDAIIGRLSTSWEVRYAPNGRPYFVNHKKQTTQFTDPRLVAHAKYLMTIVKNGAISDKISIARQELMKLHNPNGPCRIELNRKKVFKESYRIISQMNPDELKKRLFVKFKGEEGLDYGGVAREWFHLLSREMLNPIHGLFQYTNDDIYNLQINPNSGIVYREHLSYMNFCGRILGMAVFHRHYIDVHFTLPFYKMLLSKPITFDDIMHVDPELYRSFCWMLKNDITGCIETTFSVQHNAFGQLHEFELKKDGRNISITEENKKEYVALYANYRCRRGIQKQFDALQRGFFELVPPSIINNLSEQELELLIGGLSRIDVEDWKANTKLKNCTPKSSLVRWFWKIIQSYSEEQRAKLLQFVTGSSRVPIHGFRALQGANSELRMFTIHLLKNACTDNLPKAHTCFNRLDIPPYETYDKLHDKLTQAIEETLGFSMQ